MNEEDPNQYIPDLGDNSPQLGSETKCLGISEKEIYQNLGPQIYVQPKDPFVNLDDPNQSILLLTNEYRGTKSGVNLPKGTCPNPSSNHASKQQSSSNPSIFNQVSAGYSFPTFQCGVVGTVSSEQAQSNQHQNHEGSEFIARSETKSSESQSTDLNSSKKKSELSQEDSQQAGEGEKSKKFGETMVEKEVASDEESTEAASRLNSSGSSNREPELSAKNSSDEKENEDELKSGLYNLIKVLLKQLYKGVQRENILNVNEPYLLKFFNKHPQTETDAVAILVAGLYLALDDYESVKTNLARITNPDITDDDNQNAGIHRAYYIMQANLEIKENNLEKAQKLLKQCWNIPQKYFFDGKENFLDFYATTLGRIYLKEGNLKQAEKCFQDALSLRLSSKNSRLISSSYNELALIYIEKGREQALRYLEKAREYDKIFQEELNNDKYNLLSGHVDFKRPDLAMTERSL